MRVSSFMIALNCNFLGLGKTGSGIHNGCQLMSIKQFGGRQLMNIKQPCALKGSRQGTNRDLLLKSTLMLKSVLGFSIKQIN